QQGPGGGRGLARSGGWRPARPGRRRRSDRDRRRPAPRRPARRGARARAPAAQAEAASTPRGARLAGNLPSQRRAAAQGRGAHRGELSMRLIVAIVIGFAALGASAQSFVPAKTVTIVSPNPPGGAVDIQARVFAQALQQLWGGKPVIVEYKP